MAPLLTTSLAVHTAIFKALAYPIINDALTKFTTKLSYSRLPQFQQIVSVLVNSVEAGVGDGVKQHSTTYCRSRGGAESWTLTLLQYLRVCREK